MRLFIAEKPELGRAIAQGLGGGAKKEGYIRCGDDVVTWCFGHLLELCEPEDYDPAYQCWRLEDLPIVPIPWRYKPRPGAQKQLDRVLKLLQQADTVVHAGDPDEEGQLLVEEVLRHAQNAKPVQRLLINDLTPKLVQKALGQLRDNTDFEGLYQAALARSVADQLYGFNMTRAYTLAAQRQGHGGVLSVGRVQTPILGLVVNRDRQHEGHAKRDYFVLSATVEVEGLTLQARLVPPDNAPTDDKGRVTDEAWLQTLAAACDGQTATVCRATTTEKTTPAPLPYNLLTLQAEAHKQYGLKPDEVLPITQALRERHTLITYNRSDCPYLSEEQHGDAPGVLAAIRATDPSLQDAATQAQPALKSRAFNSANVSAHHAIIPTQTPGTWGQLSPAQQQVYRLIARAYVAQFYPAKQTAQTTVELDCAGYGFRVRSTQVLTPGWSGLFGSGGGTEADADPEVPDAAETADDLQHLHEGAVGRCRATQTDRQQTKPPPRYTHGTLLKDLASVAKYVSDPQIQKWLQAKDHDKKGEHGGIGTPATRSAILATLLKRGFLAETGKHLLSTDLGRQFVDRLPERARTPDMTALWHVEQQRIREGDQDVETFLRDLVRHMEGEITALRQDGLALPAASGTVCPICQEGVLRKRQGKNGPFWGCNRYPDCKQTYPDTQGQPDLKANPTPKAEVSQTHACQVCQAGLIRRPSKKKGTYWWGCSGYPACHQTYLDSEGQPDYAREAAKAGAP